MIYLIGSLRNKEIPTITNKLTEAGFEVFSEWAGSGEFADDSFKAYHKALGRTYLEALKTDAAKMIFEFDKKHLEQADTVILTTPCGRSGHLELGWALGKGKKGYYLLDDPDRWDLMLQFATGIFTNLDDLIEEMKNGKVIHCKSLEVAERNASYCSVCGSFRSYHNQEMVGGRGHQGNRPEWSSYPDATGC